MWRFPSLRYVMTSNVPFEKNKMASILAASVITTWSVHKMQSRVKFKENRKRYRKETEICNQYPLGNYQRESFLQISYNKKRRETESRIVK